MRVWIVLAAIAGGGAIVAAQVAVRGSSGEQGVAVAGKVSGGSHTAARPTSPLNAAQEALQGYMIERQLRLLDTAPNQAVRNAVILNNCTGMMYVRNKTQQQHEIQVVMQIDRYQPSPSPWDQVRNAPSMVSELLKLTPDQSKQIRGILDRYSEEDHRPWQEFFASEKYATMSPAERGAASKALAVKLKGGLSNQQLADISKKRSEQQLSEVRALLTPAQRSEWDAIKGKYDASMAAISAKP